MTICFYSIYTSAGINSSSDSEQVVASFMGLIIILLDFYFLFYEFVMLMRSTRNYFTDVFSIVDLLSAALNIWLVFQTLSEAETNGNTDRRMIKNCTVLAVILMWVKLFY